MKLDILPEKLTKQVEGKHIIYEKLVNTCNQLKSDIICDDMQGGSSMSKHATTILIAVQVLWNELEEVKAERDVLHSQLDALKNAQLAE